MAQRPVEDRLSHALVKGIDAYIEADTEEARAKLGPSAAGHRGPLMAGMSVVGEYYLGPADFPAEVVSRPE